MSIVEKPELSTTEEVVRARKSVSLKWLRDEGRYLGRGLAAYPLYALLFGTLALFTLAYQMPLDFQFKLGPDFIADHLYAASFNKPEGNGEFGFRWTSDESYLRFPGVGRLPHSTLEVTMQVGGRPPALPPPQIQVWADGRKLGEVVVGPGAQVYRFDYRPEGRQLNGDLIFTLKVPDSFKAKDHNLPLGVVVTEVRLQGGSENNRPVVPSFPHLALLLTTLVVFYLALVRANWSAIAAASWAGLVTFGIALALAFARLHLTPAVETLFMTTLIAYPLLVLGLRTTQYLRFTHPEGTRDLRLKNSKLAPQGWSSTKIQNSPSRGGLRPKFKIQNSIPWLGLIFVATFVVKAAGLNHPAFQTIDHWFRVHQILRFWDSPGAFWQQYFNVSTGQTVTGLEGGSAVLGQWGVAVSLPYSPLFYLFAAPLGLIWREHDPNLLAAVNLLVAWLEASSVFLIFSIACQVGRGAWAERAGLIAAAFYGFYPLSFLLFSDGGYNSILAHWLTLLFVALLFKSFNQAETTEKAPSQAIAAQSDDERKGTTSSPPVPASNSTPKNQKSPWLTLALIITLALTLLSHTSTLLLVGSLVIVATILFTIYAPRGYPRFTIKEFKIRPAGVVFDQNSKFKIQNSKLNNRQSSIVNRQFLLIGLGGFGLAFAVYYGWYIVPFVQNSLPTLLSKIGSGSSIGQNRALLGTELLTGFWPQLWEHFRLFPFFLTLISLGLFTIYDLRFTIKEFKIQNSKLKIFLLAWLIVFLLFALVDLKVNLLQKHMLFAAPLLCLGTGFALSMLWEWTGNLKQIGWRWAVKVLTGLLVGFIIWQGLVLWYGRVFFYTLPPGSG